jgi:hypothetical protein
LIQQADKLVYAAKQDGKDCVRHRHLNRSGMGGIESTPAPEVSILRSMWNRVVQAREMGARRMPSGKNNADASADAIFAI